jgi:hypothetical protein
MTTRAEIEAAQNGDSENVWGGFALLNLPDSQINRDLTGGTGTVTDDRHKFIIHAADLIGAGIAETDDTIIIYYQLHESRTFIWENSLQKGYDASPTDVWGGYLYGISPYSTDGRTGSGYVPGSSGHVHVETLTGSQDVPIPIPEKLPGAVSGLKWLDINGNAAMDEGEETLPGWKIHVYGEVEGIEFHTSILTDGTGSYSFPNLTVGTWRIAEAEQREVPPETGYEETYPNATSPPFGVATRHTHSEPGQAVWAWDVDLTIAVPDQADVNFGNRIPPGKIIVDKVTDPSGHPQEFEFEPDWDSNFLL